MALILVVDDDEDVRNLLEQYLSLAGYDVKVAEDAIVAGSMVLEETPNLIILDVNMPYMNGFEFAQALNDDVNIPYIPIVFLTASDSGHEKAMALGAVAYHQKPISAPRLMELVQRYVRVDG